MQRMATPGLKAYPEAEVVKPGNGYVGLILVDIAMHGCLFAGAMGQVTNGSVQPITWAWGAALLMLATMLASARAAGLRPRGISWRRRLGLLAVVGVLWRGGPYNARLWLTLLIVIWTGVIWVATLVQGRRISAAIARLTGEEGLGDDPSRSL